jgi:tRNA nucleotidyltransferase (CCA-adding enzyme)
MCPAEVELSPPDDVRRITARLEEAGFATWAVGGAVRDRLAGLQAGDWDLATAARPRDVQRLFRRTVAVGVEHGTVGVLGSDRRLYEVTTFRRDVQTFGRHAVVAFADSLEEDLERRDFTINAVAWHPIRREVRDPHGGQVDLREGILRAVGVPAERFAEDRLRVLRALRFAGRFSLRIEERTWSALVEAVPFLPELSAERVREELMKLLVELRAPSASLRLYETSGALRVLYPELQACVGSEDHDRADVWSHLLATADAIPRHRPLLRMAGLLHDVGKPVTRLEGDHGRGFPRHAAAGAALAREVLRRLKASNADTDLVVHLVAQHEGLPHGETAPTEIRHWASRVGRAYVRDLFRLHFANMRARGGGRAEALREALAAYARTRRVLARNPPLEIGDLAIGGAELRALDLKPGPQFGAILRALLDRVLDDPQLNTVDDLIRLVKEEVLPGIEG